ncbi:PIN domain-containing protein [Desulfonatronum parangueonense]
MYIYLDACCLQRPFDDQTQPRIRVETEAVLAVLSAVEADEIQLVRSDALDFETTRIPNQERREQAMKILDLARKQTSCSDQVIAFAEKIETTGIQAMDALHVALASSANVNFFVTCDDKLLHKGKQLGGLSCQVVSIFELIQELMP